ncbi:penicillin-binding protein activator [Puniceibacterium sp. IMCC21224]|uniref:penicillin-binding protein activator n=1 Tax=Puniceibacterium sp. IMCC21224 TaxID=1618204 RepID=UPI00064E1180|nr:penicillin-binding protein activator [Puniceibacterium sp. IMCC21224]KMK66042.1 amino acid/amide ABC transporter substrate-binding protein, HAAT family [Puniceibacterium sp. IMCC21224]
MFAVLSPARKVLRRVAGIASVAVLTACAPIGLSDLGSSGGGPSINPNAPVQVALLVPKSDPGAASVARSLENAARLAIADLGGVNIDLRVYDTAGQADTAAAQAQRAVDEGAKIILGPLFQNAANAAGVAVADEGINVLSFSNNTAIAGGNVFVLGSTFDNTATRLLSYARSQGKGDVAVLYTDNVPGQVARNAITTAAARTGATVVGAEAYALNTESLTAAVGRVKGLVDSGAAQSIFLTDDWDGGLSVVLQLAPEQGISPASTQYIGLTRWDIRSDGFHLPGINGSYFAMPDTSMAQNFSARYAQAYGSQPHNLGGLAFDGIAAIGALVKAGRKDALTAKALTQSAGFQGTGGVFRLLADGTNQRALAVATVRNNQVVILDPAPRSFGGAGF